MFKLNIIIIAELGAVLKITISGFPFPKINYLQS